MENRLKPIFAALQNSSPGKDAPIMRAVMMIGSGLLSSTALAAAVKAWLENRKTKVTIQIEGRRKTLTYEGHHLSRDAATLQVMIGQLGDSAEATRSVDSVRVSVTDEAQEGRQALLPGGPSASNPGINRDSAFSQAQTTRLQRFVAWLGERKELLQKLFTR